jgi:hypothetical protein
LPKEVYTPKVQEGMVRLGTGMPFRRASSELEFFTKVVVAESTIRETTESAGAAQVALQEEQVAKIEGECPESPAGPERQMMSLDGSRRGLERGQDAGVGSGGEAKRREGRAGDPHQRVIVLLLALRNIACNDRWTPS